TLADSGPGSLRDAIGIANLIPTEDTIVFAPEVRGGTVNLTTSVNQLQSSSSFPQPAGPSALLVVTPIIIQGTGETLRRDSADAFRLFQVTEGGSLTLQNLTLDGGLARGFDSAAGLGGAVYSQGTLTLLGCSLTGNQAVGGDGGFGSG